VSTALRCRVPAFVLRESLLPILERPEKSCNIDGSLRTVDDFGFGVPLLKVAPIGATASREVAGPKDYFVSRIEVEQL